MAAEKVSLVNLKKEPGYLYFIDKEGDISRAKMARVGRKKSTGAVEKVKKLNLKKDGSFLYFLDKDGDVARTLATRGR